MNISKNLRLVLLLAIFIGLTPTTALAAESSPGSIFNHPLLLKIKDNLQYFFTFGVDNKITLLDKQAEAKLNLAQDYAADGKQVEVKNSVQNYLQVKQKQGDLLDQADDDNSLNQVRQRTLEQQQTMEQLKLQVGEDIKPEIVQAQEQVVNQVAQHVVVANGVEGRDEFFQQVEHVWAPGTGPGGESGTQYAPGTSAGGSAGVVVVGGSIRFAPGTSAGGDSTHTYEGGAGQQFAPGSSAGGNATNDTKNVEVKGN